MSAARLPQFEMALSRARFSRVSSLTCAEERACAVMASLQVFAAAVSGVVAHRRVRAVHAELGLVGGVAMAAGSLAGAVASRWAPEGVLLLTFALMTAAALGLMLVPIETAGEVIFAEHVTFSRPRAAGVSFAVGLGAGLIGAGGAFLLVPLLLVVVGVPIRVTIGSSLAITAVSALTGFAGKLATGQIPWLPAVQAEHVGIMRPLTSKNWPRLAAQVWLMY